MLGEQWRQPIEHIVDRAVLVVVDLVGAALGNAMLGELGRDGVDRRIDAGRAHRTNSRMVIAPDLLRLASMPWPKARETSSSTRLLIDCTGARVELRRIPVLQPVERRRSPAVVALEADLACADRPGRRRGINGNRLPAGLHAVPEVRLGRQELALIEPVGSNLEHLELVIAEDHREARLLVTGHRQVMLELGHVALQHFLGLGKGAGVLGFPNGARGFDHPVQGRSSPLVDTAGPDLAMVRDAPARQLLEPQPVERLGPAAEHHWQKVGEISWRFLAALLEPEVPDLFSIAREDDVGIAAADERSSDLQIFRAGAESVQAAAIRKSPPSALSLVVLGDVSERCDAGAGSPQLINVMLTSASTGDELVYFISGQC